MTALFDEAERKAREITADRAAENFSAAVEAGDRAEAAEQRLREVEAALRYIYDSTAEDGQWEESGVHNFVKAALAPERTVAGQEQPFAWVIPGDDNANANGFLGAMCYKHGEFTKPLYVSPASPLLPGLEPRIDSDIDAGWLPFPSKLHPATRELVLKFAFHLAIKLRKAEQKYGYSDGWKSPDWMDECRAKLREHVEKGDPLDVAAYCAFLHWHRESTAAEISRLKGEGSDHE